MNVTCKIDLSSSEANKLFRGINSISELSDLYNPLFKLYHGYNISNSVMNVFMDSIESRYNKQGDLYSKLGIKNRLELERMDYQTIADYLNYMADNSSFLDTSYLS